jgi:hypothetical protein
MEKKKINKQNKNGIIKGSNIKTRNRNGWKNGKNDG